MTTGLLTRSAGVLLHPTSLPGRRLGVEAERFVDWLAAAGQSWWQVLPLGPPDEYGSPYTSASAFAGWPGLLADPGAEVTTAEIAAFRERHRYWISDWESFSGSGAVADQVRFEREWRSLRAYAAARGVRILGDLPIYVAPGSADTIALPQLFDLAEEAGAPPDYFNPLGQHWGNPLYAWPAHRADRVPVVDRAATAFLRAHRPDPDRPLPRLRRRLGDHTGSARGDRPLAERPGPRAVRRGRAGGWEPFRSSPRTWE